MSIAWNSFTPWSALAGGLLIGAAASVFLLGNGRVAGISGIIAGPLRVLVSGAQAGRERTRILFLAGLLASGLVWRLFAPWPAFDVDTGPLGLLAAGLLVGFGARLGGGCTSGHGVCGLSRFSLRSLVNVLCFIGTGMLTVFVLRHFA